MKKDIFILLILIGFVSCSNGQNKDYSKDIIGCWKSINAYYEIKSNYPKIDSLVIADLKEYTKEINDNLYITKIEEGIINEYDENKTSNNNPLTYSLRGDTIYIRGTFRQSRSKAKICISNDTLYIETESSVEFNRLLRRQKKYVKIPKDIKLEKMVRHAIAVRVNDCDQYQ